jgi:hypothetical protein
MTKLFKRPGNWGLIPVEMYRAMYWIVYQIRNGATVY